MDAIRLRRFKSAWLEALLALALFALLLQAFPSWGPWLLKSLYQGLSGLAYYLDIRNYSWAAWGWMNLVVLFLLVSVRFGPDLRAAWRERSQRLKEERAKAKQKQELREHKEMLERIKEGRRRRVY